MNVLSLSTRIMVVTGGAFRTSNLRLDTVCSKMRLPARGRFRSYESLLQNLLS
ncbi:MAG: hypothetical protein OXC19_19205 [Bryobacterales bacterium]|nr:hypothetical protein [Bryobacterales bacterium]